MIGGPGSIRRLLDDLSAYLAERNKVQAGARADRMLDDLLEDLLEELRALVRPLRRPDKEDRGTVFFLADQLGLDIEAVRDVRDRVLTVQSAAGAGNLGRALDRAREASDLWEKLERGKHA